MGMITDLASELTPTKSLVPATRTASANGTSLDTKDYEFVLATLDSEAGTGTTPTLDVAVEDSANDSTFAPVTGLSFTQVTDAGASIQVLKVDVRNVRRYVRLAATIAGGTPSFAFAANFHAQKKKL